MNRNGELELDSLLCFALYKAANNVKRTYKQMLSHLDLTYPQVIVLSLLWDNEGVQVKDIGVELGMETGTLSPILKRLEKNQFVIKTRNDDDQRAVRLFLTERGKGIRSIITEVQRKVFCNYDLTSHEFFELLDRLHQISASLSDRPAECLSEHPTNASSLISFETHTGL